MKFDAQRGDGVLLVKGYAGRGFRVGDREWPDGVLVTPEAAHPLAGLDAAAFAPLAAATPAIELVILGTGAAMRRPDPALLAALAGQGLATEFMDSRAAARTYNVLALEGRRVAAALLPTEGA